jgi:O-antigen/teichoic acid export membrane protein
MEVPEGASYRGLQERSLARRVVEGTGWITAAGGISKLFSLVSSPILTRALGPVPYGVVALVGTISSLATTAALLGLDLSYSRFFFSGTPREGASVERFCWRFSLTLAFVTAAVAGGLWWWGSTRAGLPANLAVILSAGILLTVVCTMAGTRRRLMGSYPRIAASIAGSGLVGAALSIVLALYWRKDAWALLVGAALGTTAAIAILGIPPVKTLLERSGLSGSHRWDVMRLGAAGVVTMPMYWLMNTADRWFLGVWKGQEALGVYSFAANVGLMGIMLNSALTLTWFPEMSRVYEASGEGTPERIGRLWARMAAGLLVVWVAITAAGGDAIRLISAPSFHEGAAYVPWIAGGVFFYGVASLATTGLVLRKNMAPLVGWWSIGAGANLLMNYLLVRDFGSMGAAVAACASFALIAMGVMWSSQARFRLPVSWNRLAVAGCLALAGGIVMHAPWSANPAISLLLKFPAGMSVAVVLVWIVAPDWMMRMAKGEWTNR